MSGVFQGLWKWMTMFIFVISDNSYAIIVFIQEYEHD